MRRLVLYLALVAAAACSRGGEPTRAVPPAGGGSRFSGLLVHSWDGAGWRLDSGLFGSAIARALQRTDVDNLDHVSPDRHGLVRLHVANERKETDHLDGLAVLAVDHPAGTRVAPDPEGGLHVLRQLEPPITATDLEGLDVLARVRDADGWGWTSRPVERAPHAYRPPRDGLALTFRRPPRARRAHLVLDGGSTPWISFLMAQWLAARGPGLEAWYDSLEASPDLARAIGQRIADETFLQVWVATRSGWKHRGLFWETGPEVRRRQVIELDLDDLPADPLRIRLAAPPAFWWIDAVSLDPVDEVDGPVYTRVLSIGSARWHDGTDARAALAATDGRVATLETGQWIEVDLEAPRVLTGQERSYLLRSTGWHRLHVRPRPTPDGELLELIEAPGGLARAATIQLNAAIRVARGRGGDPPSGR